MASRETGTVVSTEEIFATLDKMTIEIQYQILKKGHVCEESYTRKFKELLCMNTLDLAFGHRGRGNIKAQTTKNMARLLASMIIIAMLETKTGYLITDDKILSWNECKRDHIWTRYSIQSESQTIYRLDWFLYRLIINGSGSIKQWLQATKNLGLKTIDDDSDYTSDLEYDHEELREETGADLKYISSRKFERKKKRSILRNFCSCFVCK